mgnify:CR=1 FL=1
MFTLLFSVVICGSLLGSGVCVKHNEPCPPFSNEECRDHLCPLGSGKPAAALVQGKYIMICVPVGQFYI